MNRLKILTAALLLTTAFPASACRPWAPWESFFHSADRNEDGKISRQEWLSYEKGTALSISIELDTANFHRLDSNRNGTLERKEVYPKLGESSIFGYTVDPCAGVPSVEQSPSNQLMEKLKALLN